MIWFDLWLCDYFDKLHNLYIYNKVRIYTIAAIVSISHFQEKMTVGVDK